MAEYEETITESILLDDTGSFFDWGHWWDQYREKIVRRFIVTLHGNTDLVLPVSSITFRMRHNEPSYLSVTVPGRQYAEAITLGTFWAIIVEAVYCVADVEALREEIIHVNYEEIRADYGPFSSSLTLVGHKTRGYSEGERWEPRGVSYKCLSEEGKWRIRCDFDPYARPGKTLTNSGVVWFTADMVECHISPNSCWMDVSER